MIVSRLLGLMACSALFLMLSLTGAGHGAEPDTSSESAPLIDTKTANEGAGQTPLDAAGAVDGVSASSKQPENADSAVASESDAASDAALQIVRSIENTTFGAWLREHPLAWNALAIAALLTLGFAFNLVLRRVLGTVIDRALERAKKRRLADVIASSKIVVPIAAIAPLLLVSRVVGVLGTAGVLNPLLALNVANIIVAFAILRGMTVVSRVLQIVDELYSSKPEVNRPGALRGYRQVAMVVIGFVGGISAAAIAVDKSPLVFLAALAAVAAVLGVVFKDILFSLVANLMVTANDAIRVGDWVELKQFSIDGRIAEIKTTAVRVQNADGTVHTVPMAKFVQEPYLNFRSKYGSPGRRVRRSFRVDMRTVRALTSDEIAALASNAVLAEALNRARASASSAQVTNLCVYRAFAERMLVSNPSIDTSLPVVVAQQESTPTGQPVDILCFIKPDASPDLASVEGALIDRLALAMPCFALRGFQQGSDLGVLTSPMPWLATADLSAAGLSVA